MARTTYANYVPQTTYYAYDGDKVIEELDGDGNVIASFVYGNYVDEVLEMRRDTDGDGTLDTTYYYLHDDLYNVLALTDANGDIVERYEYGDYGYPAVYDGNGVYTGNESAYGNPYLFNGHHWDADTELYWYRTRYMDPELGRFISRDTIGLWGDANNVGNPYTYAGNNPWTHLDPYGEGPFLDAYWDLTIGDPMGYLRDSGKVANGYFIQMPTDIAVGTYHLGVTLVDEAAHPTRTAGEMAGGVGTLFEMATGDQSGTGALFAAGGRETLHRLDTDLEFQGRAAGHVATFILGSAYLQSANTARAAEATQVAEQAAIRTRVLANIAESAAAREASNLGGPLIGSDAHAAQLATQATQNAALDRVLLGKYLGPDSPMSYNIRAVDLGATYFTLENWSGVQAQFGESFLWRVNRAFLDQQLNASKPFYFSQNPWTATSYFEKEVLHLIDRGATDFVQIQPNLWTMK